MGIDHEYTMEFPRNIIQSIELKRQDDLRLFFRFGGLFFETDGKTNHKAYSFDLPLFKEFSQAQWTKLLKEIGYHDVWVLEVAKPPISRIANLEQVRKFLEAASSELAAGSPEDCVANCRKALDAFESAFTNEEWKKIDAEIDHRSAGEEDKPTKSERINEVRKSVRAWANIGPHSDKYAVSLSDAQLCYQLLVSLVSYVSRISGRALS
jgi:hypothetical protein